ncbi:MAG: response regulator [Treponemataceae bacterium]|nr:response regulator [Treponemataceae bacterium]
MVKSFKATAISMLIVAILATVLLMLIGNNLTLFPSESESIASISYLISVPRLSSVELNSSYQDWVPYKNERVVGSSSYCYAKIILDNENDSEFVGFIYNQDTNFCTELLECGILEATTIARFGDLFPDTSENGFNKATFKVTIPPNTKKTYILEYEKSPTVEIQPIVINEHDFLNYFYKERSLYTTIIILILCFTLYLLVTSIVFHDLPPLAMGLFMISELFFYLRQTRMFLSIFMIPMPSWLCSLQIVLNMSTAMLLLISIRKKMSPLNKKILFAASGFALILALVEIISGQDMYTWINLITIVFDLYMVFELIHGIPENNYQTILTSCSILPWFVFMLLDTITSIIGSRVSVLKDYTPIMALLFSLTIYVIFASIIAIFSETEKQNTIIEYFSSSKVLTPNDFLKMTTVPVRAIFVYFEKMQLPLEIIQSSANMLKSPLSFSRISAISRIIEEQTHELKKIIGSERENFQPDIPRSSSAITPIQEELEKFNDQDIKSINDVTICIFGKNTTDDSYLRVILQTEGFNTLVVSDPEKIMELVTDGSIEVLLVDPVSSGEQVFKLCSRIREEHNIFTFPILMIINYYANYIVKKSYNVGINDFIVRPFDTAELVSRIHSQLRLKRIYMRNTELSKSEREKRTFLYFVTHNVNTPLTLLLNRIEELKDSLNASEIPDKMVIDDIDQSVEEIDDIIQNVLISFRISDGRYVNTPEIVDIQDVLENISVKLRSKYLLKKQVIQWNIPDTIPIIRCNRHAVNGILTNIIDNAIKYSPDSSIIVVSVIPTDVTEGQKTEDGSILKVTVADSGPGIPPEKQDILFDRFKDRGTKPTSENSSSVGLGLYVAKELAKLNKIELTYEDNPRGGACFILTFFQ